MSSTMGSAHRSMGPPISRSGSSGGSISAPALESREQPASSLSPTPVPPSSQTEPPKGRALSCSECKRRKIKCDRGCPCGPCILRNDQARCKPVIRWEAGCSLSEFSMLQNRVFELEGRVADMQHMLGGETSVGGASLLPLRSSVASAPPKQEPGGPAAVGSPSTNNGLAQTSTAPSQQRGGGEDDAVMMLEDFAMGNRANARRAAQKLTHDARSADSPGSPSMETGASQRSADRAIDVAARFLRFVPNPETSRTIVDYYFDRLEWYTKCLHRPSYMRDLEQLLCLDVDMAARTIRPTFLCVHLMVLCLAIHLASGDDVQRWGIDVTSAMQLCDALFAGSQQLLWASDFIGSHQLEHLQAVALISVYAYNVDEQADAAYALVGASIKIAQNLCLNRLDDVRFMEKEKAKNRLSSGGSESSEQSLLEREMGKRVWWYLVWLDWSHALSHGGSYSIHPAHNRTNLPANVDDGVFDTKQSSLQAKPLEEYTSMSFTIWRLRFLILYRESIDMINQPGGISHTQVLEMDKKLMNLLNGLPAYFQLRAEDSKTWTFGDSCHDMELLSIQITGHNRILRLHRPYLAKGLLDRNNISRKRCVEAAFTILTLFRHAKNHAPILLRVWIHIYYVFSGALVLFLDLCYDNDADARAAEEKREAVREMLEIVSEARHLSAAAKNTHNLLLGLLEAETELRVRQQEGDVSVGGAGAKRKRARTGEAAAAPNSAFITPFVALVERVLVDAASKHGSGDSTSSSMGKSPNDLGGPFDPPAKRHSTSFVRDRTGSQDGRHIRTGSMTGRGGVAGAGAGHGGYFNDAGSSSQYGRTGSGNGYPTGTVSAGISSNPSSPWGPHSAMRSTAWPARPESSHAEFASPSGNSGYNLLSSPTVTYHNDGGHGGMSLSGIHLSGGGPRTAATTNGLSSLLDEDIFSGLLMNQPTEISDWESAFASVAPPAPNYPHPSSSSHHHHAMHASHNQYREA